MGSSWEKAAVNCRHKWKYVCDICGEELSPEEFHTKYRLPQGREPVVGSKKHPSGLGPHTLCCQFLKYIVFEEHHDFFSSRDVTVWYMKQKPEASMVQLREKAYHAITKPLLEARIVYKVDTSRFGSYVVDIGYTPRDEYLEEVEVTPLEDMDAVQVAAWVKINPEEVLSHGEFANILTMPKDEETTEPEGGQGD